jgi:hypothetical protein
MKKLVLELTQVLAGSGFAGISLYGVFIYWGGETQEKIPVSKSLLLGLGAVICIIAFVVIGDLRDKLALAGEAGKESDRKIND